MEETLHGHQKVLLVDDDDQIRKILVKQLSNHGFEINEAYDGQQALERVKDFQPDLIILDIEMPKMNGYVTCERIRNQETQSKIPIIFLTGNKEDWDILTTYAKGGDLYLAKPMIMGKEFSEILVKEMKKLLKRD